MRLLLSLFSFVFAGLTALATEPGDSLGLPAPSGAVGEGRGDAPALSREGVYGPQAPLSGTGGLSEGGNLRVSPALLRELHGPLFPRLPQGVAMGSAQVELPGLMASRSAFASYTIDAGRFSFTPQVSGAKYAFYQGVQNQFGFGATMAYSFSDRLSVTLFGSYYTRAGAANPAVAGAFDASRFGGYLTWRVSDRVGLSLGAQQVYGPRNHGHSVVPIIKPTYRVGNTDIGIDFGPLVYELLMRQRDKAAGGAMRNPTIGPPVGGPPPIRPHE